MHFCGFHSILWSKRVDFEAKLAVSRISIVLGWHCHVVKVNTCSSVLCTDHFAQKHRKIKLWIWKPSALSIVNSRLIRTKFRSTCIEVWLKTDSRHYGLSLLREHNDNPKVSAITRVDCIYRLHIDGCMSALDPQFTVACLFVSIDYSIPP